MNIGSAGGRGMAQPSHGFARRDAVLSRGLVLASAAWE